MDDAPPPSKRIPFWRISIGPYHTPAAKMSMRRIIYRPLVLAAILVGLGLVAATVVLVGASWRSLHRLEVAHRRLSHLGELQRIELALAHSGGSAGALQVTDARHQVLALAHDTQRRSARLGLEDVARRLTDDPAGARKTVRRLIKHEQLTAARLLGPLGQTARTELAVSVAIVVALPLTSLLLVVLMRRKVVLPLRNLGQLMGLLARQDYRSMPLDRVDPMIQPLYKSYNHMVHQLSELDRHQHQVQSSLRDQVHQATRALLEQQRSLARAERLAAVGEVAAGLAHELRNPLAGLQVALGNLRGELSDPQQQERLDHMLAEVRRVVQLLNSLLGQARVTPDAETSVELAPAVDELLELVRYQLPERLTLVHTVPPGLRCRLPRSRLHQAMLNLVLNAAQAIGDRPGQVTIHASRQAGALHLVVEDDGPGLPDELLRRGVRPFASWREQGTGLGLAVVRRFVQDLGGELRLANREGGGACITLLLPCEVEDA